MMLPEPCFIMIGAACLMPSITERTSVAIAASNPSTGMVSMAPTGEGAPALLNKQSSRPHFARQASNIAFTSASLVASVFMNRHLSLPRLVSSERPSSSRRPVASTLAPSWTKISAVRRPMPLVAPVTMVILPSSLPMDFSPFRGRDDTPTRAEKCVMTVLGILGGSGVYDIAGLEKAQWRRVASPFGETSDEFLFGGLAGHEGVFVPRHGRGHVHSPSSINYRANIDALKRVGVTDILSLSAC